MSNTELTIYHPPLIPSNVNPLEVPPAIKRGAEIVGSLAVGAIGGYIFYWMTRLVARLGMLGEVGGAIHPLPYILAGIASAALVETARLTYDLALVILGDRKTYENLAEPEKASTFDSLRQRTWKVVTRLDKLQQDVDVIFSRFCHIRTAKEIREKAIPDRQLYFMEVTRREFWAQARETITSAIPQEVGIYAVEAAGYTILGGHLFVWLYGIMFLNGLIDKVGKVYQKKHEEERKERIDEMEKRKRAFDNKVTCQLLEGLYPDEFAELEAQDTVVSEENDLNNDPMNIEGNDDVVSMEEDESEVIEGFVKGSADFDPRDYKDVLAYRHTVFQSTYPIEGFAVPVEEEEIVDGNEENVVEEQEEMQLDELPDNFVLVEIEGK
jgi:hypothetical protein